MLVYLFLFLSFRTKQLNDKPTFCIIGGLGDLKKWGNYPRVIAETVGGGYPPRRVIRIIRVRIELPCPPLAGVILSYGGQVYYYNLLINFKYLCHISVYLCLK